MSTTLTTPNKTTADNTQPPMTELRYFKSDKGVTGSRLDDDDDDEEEGGDEFDELMPPQQFVGASSLHSRAGRFSLISAASDITILDFEESEGHDEDENEVRFQTLPTLERASTTDSMPTLPLRRNSSNPRLTEDFMPKLPGRRTSSATLSSTTLMSSKTSIDEVPTVPEEGESRQGSVKLERCTIATAGA